MADTRKMKVKIIINTMEPENGELNERRSEIWSGELELRHPNEYLTKISVIAQGIAHPICEVPFSPYIGYYRWIPPEERKNDYGILDRDL